MTQVSFYMRSLLFPIILLCGVFAGGCQTPSQTSLKDGDAVVMSKNTKFLPAGGFYGQSHPLFRGDRAELVKRRWGFSTVRLRDGRLGEVATEDLISRSEEEERGGGVGTGDLSAFSPKPRPEAKLAEEFEGDLETEFYDMAPVEPDLPEWEP
jgi:hypothetical protein